MGILQYAGRGGGCHQRRLDLRGSLRRGGGHQEPLGLLPGTSGRDRRTFRKLDPVRLPPERTAGSSDLRSLPPPLEGHSTVTKLSGKTALVTGASRGIGRASALALAAAGAQVLVHYSRGAKEADGVVAEIRKAGGRADAIATDLAAADGASKLARQARSIVGDRLDILVVNAGISKAATIEETTVEDYDMCFADYVRPLFFIVRHLLPLRGGGRIIVCLSPPAAPAVASTTPE